MNLIKYLKKSSEKPFVLLGFRSDVKWKKIISIVYLSFCFLYFLVILFTRKAADVSWWNFFVEKIDMLTVLALMLSPYALLSESCIREKIPLFKKKTGIATAAGFAVVLCGFGLVFQIVGAMYETVSVNPQALLGNEEAESEMGNTGGNELEIIIEKEGIDVACGEDVRVCFTIAGADESSAEGISFVSGNEAVAQVFADETQNGAFYVRGVTMGTTDVYIQALDGAIKSNVLTVEVVQNVKEIHFDSSSDINFTLWDDEEKRGTFSVAAVSETYNEHSALEAVSEDSNVAMLEIFMENGSWRYKAVPTGIGETYVYVKTKDGMVTSEKIKISVIAKEELAEESLADEGEETAEQETIIEDDNTGPVVYITPTGKKYHRSAACAGKNAMDRNLGDVDGIYDPCKKCA